MNNTRRSMALTLPADLAGAPAAVAPGAPDVLAVLGVPAAAVLVQFEQALNGPVPPSLPELPELPSQPHKPHPAPGSPGDASPSLTPAARQTAQETAVTQAPVPQPGAESARRAMAGPAATWPAGTSQRPQQQAALPAQHAIAAPVQVAQPLPPAALSSLPAPPPATQPSPATPQPLPQVAPSRLDVLPAPAPVAAGPQSVKQPITLQPPPQQAASPAQHTIAAPALVVQPLPPAALAPLPASPPAPQTLPAVLQPQVTPSRQDFLPAPVPVTAAPQSVQQHITSQPPLQPAPQLAALPAQHTVATLAQVVQSLPPAALAPLPASPPTPQPTPAAPQPQPQPQASPSRQDVVPAPPPVSAGPQSVRQPITSQPPLPKPQQLAALSAQHTNAAPAQVVKPLPPAALTPLPAPQPSPAAPQPQPQVTPSRQDVLPAPAPVTGAPQSVQQPTTSQPPLPTPQRLAGLPAQHIITAPAQVAQPLPHAALSPLPFLAAPQQQAPVEPSREEAFPALAPVTAGAQSVQQPTASPTTSPTASQPPLQQASSPAQPHIAVPARVPVHTPTAEPRPVAATSTWVANGLPLTDLVDDEERFAQALEQAVPAQVLPAPFFAVPAPAAPQATAEAGLRERLLEAVQQLMVSDTHPGGAQVRMVLHESLLPGTAVTVQQVGAQLLVSFECTAQASRQRLDRSAPAFAQSLARRLGRDVLVQVHDQTGDALEPVQARADASEAAL